MFIYGQLSPTPVLPSILADALGFEIATYFATTFGSSDIALKYVATLAFHIPANMALTQVHAETAATASTVFSVQKNNVQVGTMTFGVGGIIPTYVMASQTNFVAGDRLTIVAPASPDATLAKALASSP